MQRARFCTTSGTPLVEKGSTTFPCPNCGEAIGRAARIRIQAVPYVCPSCAFEGP